ncbi:hypothetical protein EYR40_005577 [Pleurotus pulmonarius]|nr:hypothetical protein EYR36_006030 [Pleurotus pulmonarius]KAF4600736.1 hypothetical protein EYR38_005381 [Pleurotus pulmonarius]KAF4602372.1 hypothetical protein EYR40_005577 [Pleurotus pulmonarius]
MLGALRTAAVSRAAVRTFATSRPHASDVSKLILIGHLGRDPEVRLTKTDKEFVVYTVATQNYPPPPPGPDGERMPSKSTWHRIMSFSDNANKFLRNMKKGSKVYVEANFELREPEPDADPSTPQGQRQIFLRHENLRVLNQPKSDPSEHQETTL